MRSLYPTLLVVGAILTSDANAQLSFGGQPYGIDRANALPDAPLSVMAPVDANSLMAEDEARAAAGVKGPYRFGFNHATNIGLDNAGIWTTMSNGDRVWRAAIQCPGAYSVNLEFHEFVIPKERRYSCTIRWATCWVDSRRIALQGRPNLVWTYLRATW